MRSLTAAVLASAATVLVHAAAAQEPKPPKPEKYDQFDDPYSGNDAEVLAALGYADVGAFLWADGFTTRQIQDVLGDEKVIFIETRHFKLGSTLRSFPWPKDKDERQRLEDELDALRRHMPKIPRRLRRIDPWLRAHLFAWRLEQVWAELCDKLAIDDSRFPAERGQPRDDDYMGEGPYLGQPDKFTVLLCHKATSFGVFTATFCGKAESDSRRVSFHQSGSLFFGTAAEFAEKALMDDRRLHCHVAYSVVHNLLAGYRFYWQNLPAWLAEGTAQWFARRIDDEFRNFVGKDDAGATAFRGNEWARRVRARVSHEAFPPASSLLRKIDPAELSFTDVMMAWSRVDFLMSRGAEPLGRLVHALKGPLTTEARQPTPDEIVARQAEMLQTCYGWDDAAFDREWARWVLENYPKK